MPLQEHPDWEECLARFERALARLAVPTGASGLVWDLRPEGMILVASPNEEWYAPLEEAIARLASLPAGAGLTGLRARFADWRGGLAPTVAEPTEPDDDE